MYFLLSRRLVAELPATGGVIPTYSLSTVKLIRYVTGMDYFVMACEIFIVLFIVYYAIEEILEVRDDTVIHQILIICCTGKNSNCICLQGGNVD